MIKELAISNYFSIKHEQKLDLSVAGNAPQRDGYFAAHQDVPKLVLPRVVVFFGANASGKSTVLRALTFLTHFMRDSFFYGPDTQIPLFPFCSEDSRHAPTRLSISFVTALPLGERAERPVAFRYELVMAPGRSAIERESLSYAPLQRTRLLFEREGGQVRTGEDFGLSSSDAVLSKIRPNASLVSGLAQFNHPFATAIFQAAGRLSSNVGQFGKVDLSIDNLQQRYRADVSLLEAANRDIQKIDLGIERIAFADADSPMVFRHKGLDAPLPFEFQSHGTRKFLGL